MGKQKLMPLEVFEALVEDAIEDLQKSGLDKKEIFCIVEKELGLKYARKYCGKT